MLQCAIFNVCVCLCVCCSGLFCEFSPPMVLPRTSPCDNHDCLNGAQCVVVGTDPRCQCLQGYEGERCETLVSVNFVNRESYLQLPSSLISPQTNISLQVSTRSVQYGVLSLETERHLQIPDLFLDILLCFQIATDEDSGVLLYKGDNDHIAMELYRGRLRVSYDTGSYPPSAIYRYMHVQHTSSSSSRNV